MANTGAKHGAEPAWILPVAGAPGSPAAWLCGRPDPLPGHAEAISRVLLDETLENRRPPGGPSAWTRLALDEARDTGTGP